jgi:ABC-type phosphate transport system substrate-binding protein
MLVASVLAFTSVAAKATAGDAIVVIVNAQNAGAQIKRETVAAIFLRQGGRWGDGKPILAVDQSTRSAVRVAFSEQILGTTLPAVQAHWMSALAKGLTPPLVRDGNDEVIAFVRSNSAAIGYVSASTTLDATVKVLKVVD